MPEAPNRKSLPSRRHQCRPAACWVALATLGIASGSAVASAGTRPAAARPAERGLLARWQFDRSHLRGGVFRPVAGSLPAKVVGPVRFAAEDPPALLLDGNAKKKHRLDVTDDLAAAHLPAKALTAEAWVLLDRGGRWGGFVGALQDNGSYEKGWLLGYADSRFCFAVATAAAGKLTYLKAPRRFETNSWYHVVGTYDGQVQRLYVDGQPAARAAEQRGPVAYPPRGFYTIGAYRDDNELYPMAGRIERVSVYDRALTAAEVRRRFDARKASFPGIEPEPPDESGDWPTYMHDSRRTGRTVVRLALPLRLRWVHGARHRPRPAWPAPARHDYWHRKLNLRPRVVYDRAYHVVAAGEDVYFGSSADDKVYCLDAATGRVRWSFFAGGPVRLAPTLADGKVLFGCDDGCVYALAARDGALLWKRRVAPSETRIAGNERIISLHPVRTGVLVENGKAFLCAGLFPRQGVVHAALDVRTGTKLAEAPVNASPQGYLVRRADRLFCPTGRDPAGTLFAALRRRGKVVRAARVSKDYPYAFIAAADLYVGGGDGQVAAFRAATGEQAWSADVEGRAYSLAVARGRLLVGTDRGRVYCFGAGTGPPRTVTAPAPVERAVPNEEARKRYAAAAERIGRESARRRGYCLLLGSDARLAAELARRTEMRIVAVEPDERKVAAARRALDAAGLYGVRVAVHRGRLDKLPYADYLFNLVVSSTLVTGGRFGGSLGEVRRVLRPGAGVAVLGPDASDVIRREPLAGTGQWTHAYADPGNTACSGDRRAVGKMRLLWFGRPGPRDMIDRHHRNVPPLYRDGRLFVPGEQIVLALDAYNGTELWRAEVPNSRRLGVFLDCGSMVVDAERLYAAVADRCLALDVRTGRRRATLAMPQLVPGRKRLWGYLAASGGLLVGSGRKQRATYTEVSRQADAALWYDHMKLVTSDYLFALDRRTGARRWTYRSGVIVNTSLAIGGGRVYFVESHSPKALADPLGRVEMAALLEGDTYLTALDLATGRPAWRRKFDLSDCRLIVYLNFASGMLVLSGNRYVDKHLWYSFYGIDAGTGEVRWRRSHDTGFKPGGGHGEQNRHPTIVAETVYAWPLAYHLRTGKPVAGWRFSRHGHGCGNVSASAACLFWRGGNPWMWDLRPGGGPSPLNVVSRPGCFINILPAGGLVLIPEASSGCTCNFPIQTSMAYAPVPPQPRQPGP